MSWHRIDNIVPYKMGDRLDYIRQDAEIMGIDNDSDAFSYVYNQIEKDFPLLFKRISYDDIEVEFDEHELVDGETIPTYAVYIHINDTFLKELKKEFPEDLI